MFLSEDYSNRLKKLAGIIPGNIKKINFYILIGPPSIGKSTYINDMPNDTLVINRDNVVQSVASKYNLSYDDLFILPPTGSRVGDEVEGFENFGKVIESPESIKRWAPVSFENIDKINKEVNSHMDALFRKAKTTKYQNVVIDMTNMAKESRSAIFGRMQDKVRIRYIGVEFDVSDPETKDIVKKANLIRQKFDLQKGIKKTIPDAAFDRFFLQYAAPSYSEGFDKIIKINTISNLKKFIEMNSEQ